MTQQENENIFFINQERFKYIYGAIGQYASCVFIYVYKIIKLV